MSLAKRTICIQRPEQRDAHYSPQTSDLADYDSMPSNSASGSATSPSIQFTMYRSTRRDRFEFEAIQQVTKSLQDAVWFCFLGFVPQDLILFKIFITAANAFRDARTLVTAVTSVMDPALLTCAAEPLPLRRPWFPNRLAVDLKSLALPRRWPRLFR
jgi:hypothetical protein